MGDLIDDAFAELVEEVGSLGKSSQKLVILAYMLRHVDWDKVEKFALQWTTLDAGSFNATGRYTQLPVPIAYLTMKNGEKGVMMTPEDEEILKKSIEEDENGPESDQK